MAAAIVFDQAKDCQVLKTTHDPEADDVFPYPDLAPFGNHGLEQFMEALRHLGMRLVVKPWTPDQTGTSRRQLAHS